MRRYTNHGRVKSPALAEAALQDALERVEANATEKWLEAAMTAVRSVCRAQGYFTTDDVWFVLFTTESPHEPRAMGAVMRRASRLGLCKATDQYRPSDMPSCHKRPIRVWESLLWEQVAA